MAVSSGGAVFQEEEIQRILTNLCFPVEAPVKIIPRNKKKRVIVISGPTATGKTLLSLLIAEGISGEIISADSMQVYRGMDIGTAKVSIEDRERIPHHLIDVRNIRDPYNVVDFYYEARNICSKIHARQNTAIIVGGSGFYLHTLIYGPPSGPPSIPGVRKGLEEEFEIKGAEVLYARLFQRDPEYAKSITLCDKQKIIRGLEIITLTDEKVSSFEWKERKQPQDYDFHCWFLYRPRDILYKRIEERCDNMLSVGLLDEVKALEKEGLRENSTASQAIGYRHCLDFLESPQTSEDYERLNRDFKTASRRYAKRQFTWFRKESFFRWLNMEEHTLVRACDLIANEFESR